MQDPPWNLWAVSKVTFDGERTLASNQKSINSHLRFYYPFLFAWWLALPATPACGSHPSLWYCGVALEEDQEALSPASFPTVHLSPHVEFTAPLLPD